VGGGIPIRCSSVEIISSLKYILQLVIFCQSITDLDGGAENAKVKNARVDKLARRSKGGHRESGQRGTNMQGWKMREWTRREWQSSTPRSNPLFYKL